MHANSSISPEQLDDVHDEGISSDENVVPSIPDRTVLQSSPVAWWAVVAAGAAPALLIGGFVAAAALQPASYSPVRDTISALAGKGATDPWVMTTALGAVGICCLLTAVGLRPARRAGRAALACGGVATLCVAAFHQPQHGYSVSHEAAVAAGCVAMCAWPLLGAQTRHWAPLLTLPASVAATAVTLGFTMWFAFEQHQAELGLAERCAAVAMALWMLPVALTTRRALVPIKTSGSPRRLNYPVRSFRLIGRESAPRNTVGRSEKRALGRRLGSVVAGAQTRVFAAAGSWDFRARSTRSRQGRARS